MIIRFGIKKSLVFFKGVQCFSRTFLKNPNNTEKNSKNPSSSSSSFSIKPNNKAKTDNKPISKIDPNMKKLDELFSPKFDKELDKLILAKLEEGKSDENILSELLIGKSSISKKNDIKEDISLKEIEENLEKELKKKTNDPERERLSGIIRQFDDMEEIIANSEEKPLPELPMNEHLNPNRKPTEAEKEKFEIRKAEEFARKQLEVRNYLEKIHQKEQLPAKKSAHIESSLEKLKVQSSVILSENDKEMKSLVSEDLYSANKELDLDIKPPKEGDRLIRRISEKLPLDSYDKVENKVQRWKEKFSYFEEEEMEFLEEQAKEDIFRAKKLQEELKVQKKKLAFKKKVHELRKLDSELHQKPQKEDLDYQDFLLKDNKKKKESDPWMKMYVRGPSEEEILLSAAKTQEKENPLYQRFADRTTQNVRKFFDYFFCEDKRAMDNITRGLQLTLMEIIGNNALTVYNVIWDVNEMTRDNAKKNDSESNLDSELQIVQKNLQKRSKFFAGKLTRALGLKYAPDLRFFLYKFKENSMELSEELKTLMPDMVKDELLERAKEKGDSAKIKKKDFKKIVDESYDRIYRHMLVNPDYSSVIFEEKKAKKFDEMGKRIRNNRDDQGNKRKFNRNKRKTGFWGETRIN